jgi:nucleoside-diphosphate-sugar epimerase
VTESQRKRPEKSEVLRLQSSYEKAKDLLGWEPKVKLDDGLRKTIAWISEHLDLYRPDQYTV